MSSFQLILRAPSKINLSSGQAEFAKIWRICYGLRGEAMIKFLVRYRYA